MVRKKVSELINQIVIHGRTFFDSDIDALFCNWTCSGITISFTGKYLGIKVLAEGDRILQKDPSVSLPAFLPYIGIVVSEQLNDRFMCKEGEQWITLWNSSCTATKDIQIVKLTENNFGKFAILEIETDGKFEEAKTKNKPMMEIIGDSITCGFGNEAPDKDAPFVTEEENGWDSYGAVAARELGFDTSFICSSGICAIKLGKSLGEPEAMEDIYSYTDYFYSKKKHNDLTEWDFTKNPADMIIINLGTNDSAYLLQNQHNGRETSIKEFGAGYLRLVETIREKNGNDAIIICTLGPMDYLLAEEIKKTVKQMNDSGDNRVYYYLFSPIDFEKEGYGCESHPSSASHTRMASELTQYIRTII